MLSAVAIVAGSLLGPKGAGWAQAPKVVEVTASQFRFDPAVIEVSEGDHVVLRLRSSDSVHGFAIKAFKAKAAIPEGGKVVTVEFDAKKPGRFEFHCNEFCGAGHLQMKGTLVVAPRPK
jgi:cytochrome c oxidase subunit 2